jgi:hypothetical protein
MTRKVLLSIVLATMLGAAASAQPNVVIERPKAGGARQEGIVRVQLQVQLFVTGPTDESEEAERQRERVRRALYDLAGKECDLMREVIARDCRLESVNVNLNRQANPQMQGYQVGASMTYQITLK